MARKKLTPAEKKAWGEKMRQAKEKKAQERTPTPGAPQTVNPTQDETIEVSNSAPETIDQGDDLETLKRQVQELRNLFISQQVANIPQAGPQVTSQGVKGTLTKFSVNPKDYPDPRDRLFEEPKLTLQNFNRNWWDLEWEVSSVNYETKDGVNIKEPKFHIRLIRIIEDPETGEPSAKRYTLHKATFFEDPAAAIQVANQYGLEVTEEMEKTFLDEMRYLRIRDWVLESFYPPKPSQDKMNKKETVIGNRLVEVFEVNSVNSETIPFNQLQKKF